MSGMVSDLGCGSRLDGQVEGHVVALKTEEHSQCCASFVPTKPKSPSGGESP